MFHLNLEDHPTARNCLLTMRTITMHGRTYWTKNDLLTKFFFQKTSHDPCSRFFPSNCRIGEQRPKASVNLGMDGWFHDKKKCFKKKDPCFWVCESKKVPQIVWTILSHTAVVICGRISMHLGPWWRSAVGGEEFKHRGLLNFDSNVIYPIYPI